jgi:hypothetical protein
LNLGGNNASFEDESLLIEVMADVEESAPTDVEEIVSTDIAEQRQIVPVKQHEVEGRDSNVQEVLPPALSPSITSLHGGKNREEDVMEAHDDLEGEVTSGKELGFSLWDFGGQDIFQKVQHLYLTRFAVYVLAFNLSDMLDELKRAEALSHIADWYYAIDMHARDVRPNSDEDDLSLPPVILVGTHLDEMDVFNRDESLKRVNEILQEADFKGLECFQSPPDHIRNKEQGLCFFPVSNSDAKDVNIAKLRKLIFTAAEEDKPAVINYAVPVSWLECIRKINELSREIPVVPLLSKDPNQETIVKIMFEYGALRKSDSKSKQQATAATMMKVLNELGIVVYFDGVPGMGNFCIVHPQWVIDCISSMVRDFTLHFLPMDRHAMKLNGGKDWENMVHRGLVSEELLRRLWTMASEHYDFLVKLMHKLGLFATLPQPSKEGQHNKNSLYFVPSSVMRNTDVVVMKEAKASDKGIPSIRFKGRLPNGFYERVLTRLVTDWVKSNSESEIWKPEVRPALLDHPATAKIWFHAVDVTLSLDLFSCSQSIGVHIEEENMLFKHQILSLVRDAVEKVNAEMYMQKVKLEFVMFEETEKAETPHQLRNVPDTNAEDVESPHDSQEGGDEEGILDLLTPWLLTLQFSKKDAESIANNMLYSEVSYTTPYMLKRALGSCEKKEFLEELYAYKIPPPHARIIVGALAEMVSPENAKELVGGIFGGRNLDKVKPEKMAITAACLRNNFIHKSSELMTETDFSTFITELSGNTKILHVAMHCSPTDKTMFALKFETNKIDGSIMRAAIRKLCVRTDGQQGGTVECVFLNACNTAEIAQKLQKEEMVPVVIGWSTPVTDVAARRFCNISITN